MILLLVPVLCAVVGVVLYGALRATGVFGPYATTGVTSSSGTSRQTAPPSGIRERVQNLSPGCLVAVVIAVGVWILGWLIILAVGLSLLA